MQDHELIEHLNQLAGRIVGTDSSTTEDDAAAEILGEAALRLAELLESTQRQTVADLWAAWTAFRDATTPVQQADALLEFSNHFYHFATDALGFDAVHHQSE